MLSGIIAPLMIICPPTTEIAAASSGQAPSTSSIHSLFVYQKKPRKLMVEELLNSYDSCAKKLAFVYVQE